MNEAEWRKERSAGIYYSYKRELELIARGALATRLKRRGAKSLEHLSREVVNTNSTERRGTRAVLLGAKAAGLGVRY